jgi:nucleotide-binding universal stress UspA family protein
MSNHSLINADGRVLAAIDPSAYASGVAELAGWAAQRLGVELELMHAIDRSAEAEPRDLSGNLSLGTQEALLEELAVLDGNRARLAQTHGRALLEQLQGDLAKSSGVTASLRQRHGELVDTLLDLEPEVRLFVIGKRGEHADLAKGHLGSNLERVVRAVHRPVLVASKTVRAIARFLIAFDGSQTTRRCVEMVAASPLLRGTQCHLLMVGAEDAVRREQLDWAVTRLAEAGFVAQASTAEGPPEVAIAEHVENLAIDLLVMGAYGHSRIRTMILGSTTTQLLRTCRIPVLLIR